MDVKITVDVVLMSKSSLARERKLGSLRIAKGRSTNGDQGVDRPRKNAVTASNGKRVVGRKRKLSQNQYGTDSNKRVKRKNASLYPWEPEIEIMATDPAGPEDEDIENTPVSPHPVRHSSAAALRLRVVAKIKSSLRRKRTPSFKCPDCKFRSSSTNVFKSHLAVVHFRERPYKCLLCTFSTCWKYFLKRHVLDEHPVTGQYFCSICKRRFYSGSELDAHLTTHVEVGVFKCAQCFQAFSQNKFLEDHITRNHSGRPPPGSGHVCDVCQKWFRKRQVFDNHYRVHTGEQPFQCPHCEKRFSRETNRTTHIARVHSEGSAFRNFACEVCGKLFKTRPDLLAHMRSHSQERPFNCPQCDKTFKRRSDIKVHVSRHHTIQEIVPPTIPCETCGKLFRTRRQVIEHTYTHTQERPHECPHCEKRFNNASNRSLHVARVHSQAPGRFSCNLCDSLFKARRDLADHRRTRHAHEPNHKCPHCDKWFKLSSNKRVHIARVHTPGPGRFPCESCDKRFHTRPDLQAHQHSHVKGGQIKCPLCDKLFKHAKGVRSHVTRVHVKEDGKAAEKTRQCPQCDYSAANQGALNAHMNVVHCVGPARFTCEICGKRCNSRVTLERHNLTHTKEKPFKCEQCPFECSQKATLKQHVDTRHGVGRFRCEICGKAQRSASLLEKHLRIHTHEKPFGCPHCDHRSSRKDTLLKHVEVVHGDRKYPCDTCGKSLNSARQLERHRLSHERERMPKVASIRDDACNSQVLGGAGEPNYIPIACDICGKHFSTMEELSCHRVIHAMESPFNFFRFQSVLDT